VKKRHGVDVYLIFMHCGHILKDDEELAELPGIKKFPLYVTENLPRVQDCAQSAALNLKTNSKLKVKNRHIEDILTFCVGRTVKAVTQSVLPKVGSKIENISVIKEEDQICLVNDDTLINGEIVRGMRLEVAIVDLDDLVWSISLCRRRGYLE
jgi:hypothetical protein